MSIIDLNIKPINIGGEVEKRIGVILPFIILFSILFSHIPLMIFTFSSLSENQVFKYFTLIWTSWYWISLLFINRKEISLFKKIILYFPLIVPIYFFVKIVHSYLKRFYPNSDKIEEIKKFERLKKLKIIVK